MFILGAIYRIMVIHESFMGQFMNIHEFNSWITYALIMNIHELFLVRKAG